jgi:enoyl-CoA hydratase/carnithine racemase
MRGRVLWLTLDRPDKLNALTPGFWVELQAALAAAEESPEVRVVVFRGAGRSFSVGGDLESFGDLDDVASRRAYLGASLGALRAVEAFSKPTIAAVHGHALGGGCELSMVCDIVVADRTASFGTPESGVGLVPGLGVVRGRAHAGLHAMKYLVLTGESLSAEDARIAGLVNVVVDPGQHEAEAARLAARIEQRSPLALAVGKRLLGRGSDEGYDYAREAVALLFGSDDHAEGLAAFRERREPRFEGR